MIEGRVNGFVFYPPDEPQSVVSRSWLTVILSQLTVLQSRLLSECRGYRKGFLLSILSEFPHIGRIYINVSCMKCSFNLDIYIIYSLLLWNSSGEGKIFYKFFSYLDNNFLVNLIPLGKLKRHQRFFLLFITPSSHVNVRTVSAEVRKYPLMSRHAAGPVSSALEHTHACNVRAGKLS